MYKTGHDLTFGQIQERYSRIARQVSMPRYFYAYVADRVANLAVDGYILDVGCGNGYLLEQMACRLPDAQFTGLEPAPALLRSTYARGGGSWRTVAGSATDLPFAEASFDVVTLTEVLEHTGEPLRVLHEIARLLTPRGRLLLTVPNMSAYAPFWRLAERAPLGPLRHALLPWEHPLKTFQPIDTAYEFDELRGLLDACSLTVERVDAREFFPYLTATVPIMRRLYARYAQRPMDNALSRILPERLGYRLIVQCRR